MVTTHIRLLEAIRRGCTTRKAIAEATGMQKGFAAAFGAVSKGKAGCPKGTLVGDGLVKCEKADGEWIYSLSASGKAALGKEDKEAIKASQTVRHIERKAASKGKASKATKKAPKGKAAGKASGKASKGKGKAKAAA